MKTSFVLILLFFSITTLISYCTKESKGAVIIDPLKNTTWSGEFKNESRDVAESYCITFDDKGNFQWDEFSGKLSGSYNLEQEAKRVTLTFSNGSVISAQINDQKTLSGFLSGSSNKWNMLNGKLNTTVTQGLSSHIWKDFLTGETLNITTESSLTAEGFNCNFSRTNGTIRFMIPFYNWHYFLVPDGNSLKGNMGYYGSVKAKVEYIKQ